MTNRPEPSTPLTATQFSDEDAKAAIQSTGSPNLQFITSPPEKLFAREMALTGDLARSYRLAFPEKCALLKPAQVRVMAARLLTRDRVDEIYQYYKQAIAARMDIREERILQELAAIAFCDPAQMYEDDGQTLRNIHTIPSHVRAAITKFKTGYTRDGVMTEVQLIDKMKALQALVNIKNMDAENKAAKAPTVRIKLNTGATYNVDSTD